jgi:hypothetical protein
MPPRASIRTLSWLLAGPMILAGAAAAQEGAPPEAALLALADRGRAVAGYLNAVERARERAREHAGEVESPDRFLALSGREGWRVLLIKEAEGPAGKGPKILAEVSTGPEAREAGALRGMVPPRPATAAAVAHLRALQTAAGAAARAPGATPPFDEAVLREADGSFSVYLMSRPAAASLVRFGGDFLVRVARSGRQMVSLEALHDGDPVDLPAGGRRAGEPTLHRHARGDLPPPTDVARVVLRPGAAPHLVLTPRSMFRLDDRGAVTWLGPNREAAPPPPAGGRP